MQIDIKEHAQDNLQFIRETMERTERVSSLSGIGGVLMGLIGLGAAVLASRYPDLQNQLQVWLYCAVIAVTAGGLANWHKANWEVQLLLGDAGRRFVLCLAPVLFVGAVLTWLLWTTPQAHLIPGLWMALYGCGVLAAGTYAARPIMQMGACFIVAGLASWLAGPQWGNLLLGLSFGALHIVFGYRVYRHYGG